MMVAGEMNSKGVEQVKTVRPAFHYSPVRLFFELRLCLSWTWVLPVIGVAAVLVVMGVSKTPLPEHPLIIREALELGLPLIGVFLVVPLLEKEWTQGTLTQLALREPLIRILLLRLFLVVAYLVLIVIVAVFVSLNSTHLVLDIGGTIKWVSASLLTAIAPTLILAALALFVTHMTISALSGYLVALSTWLVNLIIAIISLTTDGSSSLLSFGLFGWTFPSNPSHSNWLVGKICLLTVAVLLLIVQFPLLHNEARLMRNNVE